MALRIAALVDGFNLYHSIEEAIEQGGAPLQIKWLNIRQLLIGFLYAFGTDAALASIDYFTSLQTWRKESDIRQKAYIRALKTLDIEIHYGQFKEKLVECKSRGCGKTFKVNVEKRTDVAIAARILELLHSSETDAVLLVSGDTDLIPAIETAKRMFSKNVAIAFPYNRHNYELRQAAKPIFQITIDHYKNNVLPVKIEVSEGKYVTIPEHWR